MSEDREAVQWHNLVVQWHLDQTVPLECGCDDDTPTNGYCATSVAYADTHFTPRSKVDLDGPPDTWNHDIWVAAWGKNATLIADDKDYRLPHPPKEMMWLATRLLVRGRKAIELVLYQLGADKLTVRQRARVDAEPTTVAACARKMLQDLAS